MYYDLWLINGYNGHIIYYTLYIIIDCYSDFHWVKMCIESPKGHDYYDVQCCLLSESILHS
jgi:hypothetical protein